MASEEIVFVEGGPSMQLISSPSMESLDATNRSGFKEFSPHSYTPTPPPAVTPSRGCNPCGLAFRSKPGFAPHPPIPGSPADLEHCCHGNCRRKDKESMPNNTFQLPPPPPTMINLPPPPPPPPFDSSMPRWTTPVVRQKPKTKKTSHISHLYDPPIPIPPPPPPPPPASVPPASMVSLPPPPPSLPMPQFIPPPPMAPPPPSPPPFNSTGSRNPRIFAHEHNEVSTPADLIPIRYSGDSIFDTGRVFHIAPFKRNVLVTFHRAHIADFEEFKWIIQHGDTEVWYQKPKQSWLRQQETLEASGCEPEELVTLENARPVSLETPRIWASSALVTPTDDDIYDCVAGHTVDDTFSGVCPTCTDEKSDALDGTPLVYYIVLSTCQANEPFIQGAHFNGRHIYKLIRCGSRDAAAVEAFYASGINGWSVVFTCVMRADDALGGVEGKIKRMDELWMLGEDEEEDDCTRVFF